MLKRFAITPIVVLLFAGALGAEERSRLSPEERARRNELYRRNHEAAQAIRLARMLHEGGADTRPIMRYDRDGWYFASIDGLSKTDAQRALLAHERHYSRKSRIQRQMAARVKAGQRLSARWRGIVARHYGIRDRNGARMLNGFPGVGRVMTFGGVSVGHGGYTNSAWISQP